MAFFRWNASVDNSAKVGAGLRAKVKIFELRLQSRTRSMVQEVLENAEHEMVEIMRHSVTPSGHSSSRGVGRYHTGAYHAAPDSRVGGFGGWVSADFGFINEFRDYFEYQERGFYHVRAGRVVPGTESFETAWERAEAAIRAGLRSIVG